MARRICVLGNSHVASLKEAWDQRAGQYAAFDLTFFAARGDHLSGLVRQNNLLIPAKPKLADRIAYTSGGQDRINLDAYDAFLLYGLYLTLPELNKNLSAAVRQSCCHDAVAGSLNASIASLIRAHTTKPIYAGHEPQRAFREAERSSADLLGYDAVFDMMKEEARQHGMTLLQQPRETFADDWNTQQQFTHGSKRLDLGDAISNQLHPKNERGHMNSVFGQLYLKHAFEIFQAMDGRATA